MSSAPTELTSMHAERVVLGDGLTDPFRVVPASIDIEEGAITGVFEEDAKAWQERAVQASTSYDLGDRIVAPAFIDAHTHVAMGALRGLIDTGALRGNVVEEMFYRLESSLTDDDIRAFARMGAFECLAHGVGMVWDHYYGGTALAEGIADTGLTAVVAPTLQDLAGPGATHTERQLEATAALAEPAWANRGIWAALGPHATDTVSPRLWSEVAELARTHGWPIHAHVAQSVEEHRRAKERHGCSPVALLARHGALDAGTMLLVHAIFVSDEDLRKLDPARHTLGYCPLSQMQFCFPAHVPSWTDAGLPWIVGTDCSASNDAMNVQRELPVVAGTRGFASASSEAYGRFRRSGAREDADATDEVRVRSFEQTRRLTDPSFLLSRVWSVPGRLHPHVRAGVVEAGARANLLVLDPAHPTMWPSRDVVRTLAMADTSSAIDRLMVHGRWCPSGSQRIDDAAYREARAEADRRLEHHLARVGL